MSELRRLVALALTCMIVAGASGVAAGVAAAPVQTKRQAELNILRSPLYFWRAGLHGFIRSRTRTFRTNVTVICNGGRGTSLQAHIFVCVLRYRRKTIGVRYSALGKYAFRLRIIPHSASR